MKTMVALFYIILLSAVYFVSTAKYTPKYPSDFRDAVGSYSHYDASRHNNSIYQPVFDGERWVCKDAAGNEGYNKITVEDLVNTKTGACADLRNSYLNGKIKGLTGACSLAGVNLKAANLSGSTIKCDLRGANLIGANLSSATLWKADLRGADLTLANMDYANLYGADRRGTILKNATVIMSDMGGCRYNDETILTGVKWLSAAF